jgi:hypothetical protein
LQPQQQQQKMVDGYFLCFITAKKTQEEDEGECCRRLLYALCFITTKNETSTQRLYFNKQESRSEYKVEEGERSCYLNV